MLLAGNLLATTEVPGRIDYNLMEYTQQGSRVSSQKIPQAPTAQEYQDARGLTVDPSGNVHIFDGYQSPYLDTFSPGQQPSWSYQTAQGWATNSNITSGEVAAYKNANNKSFIFASNMQSYNNQFNGIVRFDLSGGSPELFAPGTSFTQISLGLDGLLYGLEDPISDHDVVHVFNPDTLAPVRTFTLKTVYSSDYLRSIAVDGAGNIFAAYWSGTVAKYDSTGNYTGTNAHMLSPYGGGENLMNIALDTDGQIAVGGRSGEIYLTNESLTNVQTIQTGQWNAFVTFDHYIGTAPQTEAPTFSNLAGPTITYGQSSVKLGGTITAGTTYPLGSVNITLAGVTKSAPISSTDGTFSATFDTSSLGVSHSPYQITYSYPDQGDYSAVTDASKSLTVIKAVTSLNSLSSPTITIGVPTVELSGTVGSNSVLPVGQSVTVTLLGSKGVLASSSGDIGSDGSFSATISTAALPVGSYTIQYSYAGDDNFKASSGTGTLQVSYGIQTLFNTSKPVHEGAALPVKLEVIDATGDNLSSANLTLTAISIVGPDDQTYTPQAKGNANPNNVFRNVGFGYLYNLDTTGLAPGTYKLLVKVGDDPVPHAVSFTVD